MTACTCPCGQTYTTCRKHPDPEPEVASFTFIRDDGSEFVTSLERRPGASDQWWDALLEWAPTHLAEGFLEVKRG